VIASLIAFLMTAAIAVEPATASEFGSTSSAKAFGQAAASCAAALQNGKLDLTKLEAHGWQRTENPADAQGTSHFHRDNQAMRITTTQLFGQMCIVDGHSDPSAQSEIAGFVIQQIESEIGEKAIEYDGVIHPKDGALIRTFFTQKVRIALSIKTADSAVMISLRPL
jgi:hypothetical protein